MGKLDNNYDELFQNVKIWTNSTERKIKSDIPVGKDMSKPSDKIINTFDSKVYTDYEGFPFRASFKMPRHGVCVSKGVGSGYKAFAGTTLKVARISKKNRKAVDWFNSHITANMDNLKQIYSSEIADLITDRILIR